MKLFLLAALLFVSDAFAFSNCFEPRQPSCIDNYEVYEDEEVFAECRGEVEEFSNKINDHIKCVQDSVQKTIDETKVKLDKTSKDAKKFIERFNCKAEGKEDC